MGVPDWKIGKWVSRVCCTINGQSYMLRGGFADLWVSQIGFWIGFPDWKVGVQGFPGFIGVGLEALL